MHFSTHGMVTNLESTTLNALKYKCNPSSMSGLVQAEFFEKPENFFLTIFLYNSIVQDGVFCDEKALVSGICLKPCTHAVASNMPMFTWMWIVVLAKCSFPCPAWELRLCSQGHITPVWDARMNTARWGHCVVSYWVTAVIAHAERWKILSQNESFVFGYSNIIRIHVHVLKYGYSDVHIYI